MRLLKRALIRSIISCVLADSIILARITNDERPLKRVIKKFHNYASLAAPPIVPTAGSTTSVDDARETFLVELRSYQLSLKKAAMICDAETRQVEEYQLEKERIGEFEHPHGGPHVTDIRSLSLRTDQEHVTLRDQIEELKVALEHAQMLRRRKIEYDQITEKVNSLPSREELELCVSTFLPELILANSQFLDPFRSISELENDMASIRTEQDMQNRVLLAQKSALNDIITELSALRFIGKDKEALSPPNSGRATPEAEVSTQDLAVESSTRAASVEEDTKGEDEEKEEGEHDGDGEDSGSSGKDEGSQLKENDIEMGEVEEEPRDSQALEDDELEEGEASDFSSELSDPPDD